MKFIFRLSFTQVFLVRAVHRDPFASLCICQRFSLLYFPMCTKALFDDIQSYFLLDFPSTKPPLNSKRRTRVGNLQRVRHLGSFSKLNLLMNLNRVTLIFLDFFNFHFPIDFIGGQ